ncbi:MAG: DUF3050 domain-containing protein [Pirellulales bacterium]
MKKALALLRKKVDARVASDTDDMAAGILVAQFRHPGQTVKLRINVAGICMELPRYRFGEHQTMHPWNRIQQTLEPLREALLEHSVYEQIQDLAGLRIFMEHHVFAVWDFMSLLKTLQRKLCCVDVPWVPSSDPQAARLVNEIVLAEETDKTEDGRFASHFDLYYRAMQLCRADTSVIDRFLKEVRTGATVSAALTVARVPPAVWTFVEQTFAVIEGDSFPAVVAAFTFGREDLLPALFRRIVDRVNSMSGGALQPFLYYLDRHVSLDSEEHGPMVRQLVSMVCGDDPDRWHEAEQAALAALNARLNLWNAMSEAIGALPLA